VASEPRNRTCARLLVAALGLAAAVGWGAGCTTGDDPGPAVPVDPAVIYAQNCGRCHGLDGRGDPEIKKTLPVRDFSDPAFQARASNDEVARVIMAGKGQMPAFGSSLSLPKIQSLSGYVRRLGRGQVARPQAQ
jgi:cytochrome c oxidase cbb3-type subunit 3